MIVTSIDESEVIPREGVESEAYRNPVVALAVDSSDPERGS